MQPENQTLKKRIADAIRRCNTVPVGDTLVLDMATVANFRWDTLYTFTQSAGPNFLSKATGTTWPKESAFIVDDEEKLFVFMYRGRVAEYVEFHRNDEPHDPASVYFKAYFALGELFTPYTAKFSIMRKLGAYGEPDSVATIDVMRPGTVPVYRHSNPLIQNLDTVASPSRLY